MSDPKERWRDIENEKRAQARGIRLNGEETWALRQVLGNFDEDEMDETLGALYKRCVAATGGARHKWYKR